MVVIENHVHLHYLLLKNEHIDICNQQIVGYMKQACTVLRLHGDLKLRGADSSGQRWLRISQDNSLKNQQGIHRDRTYTVAIEKPVQSCSSFYVRCIRWVGVNMSVNIEIYRHLVNEMVIERQQQSHIKFGRGYTHARRDPNTWDYTIGQCTSHDFVHLKGANR